VSNLNDILCTITQSTISSSKYYLRMSQGKNGIPEKFVQVALARALYTKVNKARTVTIESDVHRTVTGGDPIKRTGPHQSGLFDLVFWYEKNEGNAPQAAVEIKMWRFGQMGDAVKKDIRRLSVALKKHGTLKHGIMVVIDWAKKERTIDDHWEQTKTILAKQAGVRRSKGVKPTLITKQANFYYKVFILSIGKKRATNTEC